MRVALPEKSNRGWFPLGFVQTGVWGIGGAWEVQQEENKVKSGTVAIGWQQLDWQSVSGLCIPRFVAPSWKCIEVAL